MNGCQAEEDMKIVRGGTTVAGCAQYYFLAMMPFGCEAETTSKGTVTRNLTKTGKDAKL
jgi:hypothetical protein